MEREASAKDGAHAYRGGITPPQAGLLLGTLWAIGCALNFHFCGDEYGFVIASLFGLPGGWLAAQLGADIPAGAMPFVALSGGLLVGAFGALIRSRELQVRWFVAGGVALALTLTWGLLEPFSSIEEARQKNGPIAGYFVFGGLASLSLTSLLAATVAAVRPKRRTQG